MNYLFTNLIGTFILDDHLKIIDQRRLGAERMATEIQEGLRNGFSVVDITDEQFSVDQTL